MPVDESLYAEIILDTSKYLAGVRKVVAGNEQIKKGVANTSKEVSKFGAALSGDNLLKFNQGIRRAAVDIGIFSGLMYRLVTVPFVSFIKKGTEAMLKFDAAMRKVNVIARMSDLSLMGLSKRILEISKAYGVLPADIANAYESIKQLSFTNAESFKVLRVGLETAIGGAADLTDSIKLIGTTIRAFGMEASKASLIADFLFKTQEKGSISIKEMTKFYGNAISIVARAGVTFGEFGAVMAVATRRGVRARTAVTGMAAAMIELQKPTKNMKKLFSDVGGSARAIQKLGFEKTLQRIFDEARRTGAPLTTWFGNKRTIKLMESLVKDYGVGLSKQLKETGTAAAVSGASFAAFLEMTKSVNFSLTRLNATVEAFKISFFIDFQTEIIAVLNVLRKLIDGFSNLSKPIKAAVLIFTGFLAVLPLFGIALATVLFGVSAITGTLVSLTTLGITWAGTMAALTAGLGILKAAFVVLVPIIGAATIAFVQYREAYKQLFTEQGALVNVGKDFISVFTDIKRIVTGAIPRVSSLSIVFYNLGVVINNMIVILRMLGRVSAAIFTTLFRGASIVSEAVLDLLSDWKKLVRAAAGDFGALMEIDFSKTKKRYTEAAKDIRKAFKNVLGDDIVGDLKAFSTTKGFGDLFKGSTLVQDFAKVWSDGVDAFNKVFGGEGVAGDGGALDKATTKRAGAALKGSVEAYRAEIRTTDPQRETANNTKMMVDILKQMNTQQRAKEAFTVKRTSSVGVI